ncbi:MULTISPECIES: hypothetical protein [unclassified Kitasatospora]|uniref:hypothetical protein n=1 Tax=unclassified Kitasatospora TaxID=2633591 RepID=UPI00381FAB59
METENDARGIKASIGIDARRIDVESGTPHCPECGTELRTAGPGRRPVYCGRACSSKAYRRRRAAHQQDAVANALVTSRVELSATAEPSGDAGQHELLELAAAVQRSTARFLENLERARRGEGDDPRCNQALALLETSLTGATQRILRKAHVLRYEMTADRLRTEQDHAEAPAPEPAAAPLDSSRIETGDPVVNVDPTPSPTTTAPRTDTTKDSAASQNPATVPQQLRLALAAEPTAHSPLARGLGAPTDSWSIDGSDLVVEGWGTPDLFAVRDPNRRLLGWVEALGDGWGTYIKGCLIIDATGGDTWLSTDAPHAVALLRAARNQQLT